MFQVELQQYIQNNPKLVKMRESTRYPELYVLKYSKKCFYDNIWNDYNIECRGAVVDRDFNLVSYPFTKIHNFGIEIHAPDIKPDTKVTAFRKINGFMSAISWYHGDLLISTTGSLDSEYVNMVRELIHAMYNYQDWCLVFGRRDLENMTFMFEVCHRNDPHIIPENEGLYLLGYRENSWHSKVNPNSFTLRDLAGELGCYTPECIVTNMSRIQELTKECKHEGYVLYTDDGISTKIKSPYYLINKWVARNPRTDKIMREDFKNIVDEEYHGLVDHIRENIVEYTAMSEQDRLAWCRAFFERS